MIEKEVKEYSNRQRINLNKNDGFTPGDTVIILSTKEYNNIKDKLFEYNALDKENQLLKDQEQNLKQIIEDVTTPIYENHNKEIEKKDNRINELELKLKALQEIASQFNIDMSQLSAIDILFRKKHHQIINDFNNSIWITEKKDKIVNADVKQISEKKD